MLKTLVYFAVLAVLPGLAHARCVVSIHGDVSCDAKGVEPGDSPARQWQEQPQIPAPVWGLNQGRMNEYKMDLRACRHADPARLFQDSVMARASVSEDVRQDYTGRLTVGIDHAVVPEDNLKLKDKVTKDQILAFWEQDSGWAMDAAREQAKEARICNPCAIAVLAGVNDQLGRNWTRKNSTAWQFMMARKYREAIQTLGSTLWMLNTPVSVKELQVLLNSLPAEADVCK